MRILLVNKFHWLKGGSETYYFELGKLLKEHGNTVAYFSMKNENNITTGDKEYFVEKIDMTSKNITKATKIIYSKKNKKLMQQALEDFKPDIVHINNFQRQLTSSIIEAIKEKNIPIVFTAHDLQAVCPASVVTCNEEKCLNGTKFNCLKCKCAKGSILKSLLLSIEASYYKYKKIYDNIDTIITPSNFVAEKLKKGGINTNIKTIPNSVDLNKFKRYKNGDEEYIFYFGRLSVEKGILNLIRAFSNQKHGKLYIAGDGPEKENIINFIKEKKIENRVKLLGFLNQEEIKKYISKSSFVVVSSIWPENCPYSIIETLAIGKPVVGSEIGGIPELIETNKNGFLYKPDDIAKLTKTIKNLFENKELRTKMGNESFRLAKEKYNNDVYYKQLMDIYNKLVGDKNVG